MRRFALFALALLPALAIGQPSSETPPAAKPEQPAIVVGWVNDRVTVRAKDAPLSAILDAIAQQSHAQLRGTPPDRKVTADFSNLETNAALEQLFGNQNFTLRYDEGGLKEIVLKGEHGEEKVVTAVPTPAPMDASEYAPPGFWKLGELFAGKRVPLFAINGQQPEKPDESWDVIMQAAYGSGDRNVRRAAVMFGMRAFEKDKELHDGVMQGLSRYTDQQLAEFARAFLRDRGKELLRSMLAEARLPDERERLHGVLKAVREADTSGKAMPFGKFPRGDLH